MEILTGVSPSRLLNSLVNVWGKSPQRIELLANKLIAYKLINSEDLTNFCIERLSKPDVWQDKHSLEWDLLELALTETKSHKFEILELICRSCNSMAQSLQHEKLVCFLYRHIKDIEDQHFAALESTLPDFLGKALKNLSFLLIR